MNNLESIKSCQLSIIIPHYNSSSLLEKLLSTIPKNKNIDVIVIDDKSDATHVHYILNLQKTYDLFFLRNNTNIKGAGICRNIGLSHAKGEWILFADADDYFTENLHSIVSKYFNSEQEVVFFMSTSIYLDTAEEAQRHIEYNDILKHYISNKSSENELKVRYQMLTPWSKMIKKEFILKNSIKFDEVIASNDIMFSTKTGFFMKKFDISENILYVVTRSHGSLTVNMNKNIFDARLKVKIKYYKFLKKHLTENQFDIFNISFSGWLFSSFRYGILEFIETFLLLKKEKVKILDSRMLDLKFIFKKLLNRYEQNKQNRTYYIKKSTTSDVNSKIKK